MVSPLRVAFISLLSLFPEAPLLALSRGTPEHMHDCERVVDSEMNRYGRCRDTLIARFVRQILEGLSYLHAQGFAHR